MADITFTPDNSIYKDRGYLRDSYEPDEIVGRDEELEQFKNALLPVVNGEEPNDIFVHGKTGVGKTVCTDFITNELEKQAAEYGVDTSVLWLNCESLNTSYDVAIELVNKLRDPDNRLSNTGYKTNYVYSQLFDELDAIGDTILIVLDELDALRRDKLDGILYHLPRARQNGDLENAYVGIIGIASDVTLREYLRSDVQSSLSEKDIHFDAYTNGELKQLLTHRAEKAFYDDAISEKVISICAAFGARDGGDARLAIQLLREAGDAAREQNADEITGDHVYQAKETIHNQRLLETIGSMSRNEKITLYALLTVAETQDEPPRTRQVYERYEELLELAGLSNESVTPRQVTNYLNDFDSMNLTESTVHEGGRDGSFKTHEINFSVGAALEQLEDVIERCGVHQSIQHYDTVSHLIEQ